MLQQLYAQKSFVVGPGEVGGFLDHLFCEYGGEIGVSQGAVELFFKSLSTERQKYGPACPTPDVSVTGSTANSIDFDWPDITEAGVGYVHASFNLDDGRSTVDKTGASQVSYTNLDPHLYLFIFITQCSETLASEAFIIIAEKDIFFHQSQNPAFNFLCYCDGSPISIPGDNCSNGLGTTNSYSFPYVNNCPANKFQLSVRGSIGEEQYSSNLFFIHHEDEDIDRIMVLSYCTPNGAPGRWRSFGDLDNYVVVFTNDRVHVYIENQHLVNPMVDAFRCGCYYPEGDEIIDTEVKNQDRSGEVEDHPATDLQLRASPNPFTDELWITVDSPVATTAQLLLFDHSGRMITRAPLWNLSRGEQQIPLATADLAPGLYHIRLQTDQGVLQQKVIKL
ncbi:MAG: T9SS type A sorting domain-containing protein [Bacteroidota bacterium]